MTATKPLDLLLPLEVKREKDESMSENDESDDTDETDDNNSSVSSLLEPSILDKDCFNQIDDPQNEFLRLTSLVRRVYFSYLHKSVLNNYNVSCESKSKNVSRGDLKKFASHLELHAVRASLEASLYRQSMLQIISDVKDNTKQRRIYKKLSMYLDTPPTTVNIGVQTCSEIDLIEDKKSSIISNDIKYSYDEKIQQTECKLNSVDEKLVEMLQDNYNNTDEKIPKIYENKEKIKKVNNNDKLKNNIGIIEKIVKLYDNNDRNINDNENTDVSHNINASVQNDIFGESSDANNLTQNDEEESRDSLIQHLEDMFCESDDSSDLTTLIEKHSGITKSNIDSEISKMSMESTISSGKLKDNTLIKPGLKASINFNNNTSVIQHTTSGKRKLSFSNYIKMKKRNQSGVKDDEIIEDKETKKMRGIWFVERVHQVSKLKEKMMELSMRNYRKHGRLREKFYELFGESDEQEMMPDSPIHIEEHLTACKERIAPWVVKYLMPYYSKKIIQDRLLFKTVAKHIADMLIIENTFPEEDCVNQYIKNYFRNKPCIKLESDIYI